MILIGTDNLNRDNISDVLVSDNIINQEYGLLICDLLNFGKVIPKEKKLKFNSKFRIVGDFFYQLEKDDYRLKEGIYGSDVYITDCKKLIAIEKDKEVLISNSISIPYSSVILKYLSRYSKDNTVKFKLET